MTPDDRMDIDYLKGVTPTADESALILAMRIERRAPTLFLRFGDGALECIYGCGGKQTCDGEAYSKGLAAGLLDAAVAADLDCGVPDAKVYWGDWRTADGGSKPRYLAEWDGFRSTDEMLHFEALLLMRESAALVDFYRAVKRDTRRKLFMGPCWNAGAARMLGADHLIVPDHDLFRHVEHVKERLDKLDPEVVLFGAGMAGNIPVVQHWQEHPERTYIALGSAMDPLFKGRTRAGQLTMERAKKLFAELL